jgi:hypothetical protein
LGKTNRIYHFLIFGAEYILRVKFAEVYKNTRALKAK